MSAVPERLESTPDKQSITPEKPATDKQQEDTEPVVKEIESMPKSSNRKFLAQKCGEEFGLSDMSDMSLSTNGDDELVTYENNPGLEADLQRLRKEFRAKRVQTRSCIQSSKLSMKTLKKNCQNSSLLISSASFRRYQKILMKLSMTSSKRTVAYPCKKLSKRLMRKAKPNS